MRSNLLWGRVDVYGSRANHHSGYANVVKVPSGKTVLFKNNWLLPDTSRDIIKGRRVNALPGAVNLWGVVRVYASAVKLVFGCIGGY